MLSVQRSKRADQLTDTEIQEQMVKNVSTPQLSCSEIPQQLILRVTDSICRNALHKEKISVLSAETNRMHCYEKFIGHSIF